MTDQPKPAPTLDQLRRMRDDIIRIAEQHGAYNVRVVASVARGEATLDSDVDLLVSTHTRVSMFDLVGLWLDLKELLDLDVSVLTDDDSDDDPRHTAFMQRVRQDAITL